MVSLGSTQSVFEVEEKGSPWIRKLWSPSPLLALKKGLGLRKLLEAKNCSCFFPFCGCACVLACADRIVFTMLSACGSQRSASGGVPQERLEPDACPLIRLGWLVDSQDPLPPDPSNGLQVQATAAVGFGERRGSNSGPGT